MFRRLYDWLMEPTDIRLLLPWTLCGVSVAWFVTLVVVVVKRFF